MLEKYENIKKQFDSGARKVNNGLAEMKFATTEMKEVLSQKEADYKNINIIISNLDKQFAEKTGITNIKDMKFLWGAVALQCVRWILIPTLDEETLTPTVDDRKDSATEGKKDKSATGQQLDKLKEEREALGFPDRKYIIMLPVPYDAMQGTEDILIPGVTPLGKNITGGNHHSATLGHDPIIGEVVGTANILTRSITFHDAFATTRKVEIPSGRTQIVVKTPAYNMLEMIRDVCTTLREDSGRLVVALTKENLHLQSDKYTKDGLPIPLLSPALQQKLLKQKWNSKELEDVIKQAGKGIALNFFATVFINSLIGTLHGFCFDENVDENINLYSVRTRKIVSTSNIISECINVAAVAAGSAVGVLTESPDIVKKSISHLDIGGMIEMIHQIASCEGLQEKMRKEFLEQELFERFASNKYSFLEEAHYG